jgi:hypothetical protein
MASETIGALTVAGFKKGATWGTEVAVAAANGFQLLADNMGLDVKHAEQGGLRGAIQQRPPDVAAVLVPADFQAVFTYENLTTMLAQVMGTAGNPTQQGADLAYLHALKVASDIGGNFGTLVVDYQTEVHEYPSVKLGGFLIECAQGSDEGVCKIKFTGAADKLNQNTASGTNKTSTIANITMNANEARLLFSQLTIRANAQGGAALSASDDLYVTGFTLEVDRGLKTEMVTTKRKTLTDEPRQDGYFMVKGTVALDKHDTASATRLAELIAGTAKKMSITFAGPLCNGATSYSCVFYLNNVTFKQGRPNVTGPGLTPYTLNFQAYLASALPTGFPTGYTDALVIALINSLSTNPLS